MRMPSAGISEGPRRPIKISSLIPAKGKLFIAAKWLCCILYALLCVFLQNSMLSYQILKQRELSAEDGSDRDTQTRGAAFELAMDHLGPRLKRVLLYCNSMYVGP